MGKIKEKFGYYLLERNIKKASRNVVVHNFDTAKTAGVIFNATHLINFEVVKKFVDFLQYKNIQVTTIGYVHSKKLIDHYLFRKGYDFFTKKDLNWYLRPSDRAVSNFLSKPFDILFNLSLETYYPIQYLVGMSKAMFKVGLFNQDEAYLDVMIDIEKEKKIRNEVFSEVNKEKKAHNKNTGTEFESEVALKVQQEIDIDFLVNQIMHYISIINNPGVN
ncbi:MAG: hypothetical protein JXB49_14875 [Bacteroidales bacterium]|nr:hypothetical protein [Bacteroidales bacterium]